jgi:predicted AlkP superfamily pyrophosphatase or phosphodiesterase
MRVILVLLDACRHDYISKETTPFLWNCATNGQYIKQIIPGAGFCERTEILTGQQPKKSGFFTAIGYSPKKSPYRSFFLYRIFGFFEDVLLRFINLNKSSKFYILYRLLILKITHQFHKKIKFNPYSIPFNFLRFFNLTEDEFDHHQGDEVNHKSLFYLLKSKDKKFYYGAFTALGSLINGDDDNRLKLTLNTLQNRKEVCFLPVYIGALDYYGHIFGPESSAFKDEIKNLDRKIKYFVQECIKIDDDVTFVFLGDHGMSQVKEMLDVTSLIEKAAKELQIKKGRDYIYFVDSTLFRIWIFKNDLRKKFFEKLLSVKKFKEKGLFINKELAEEYNIPFPDKRYGDIAWWANNGILLFPDFFHINNPYKGMHGYIPNTIDTRGMCIVWGKHTPPYEIETKELSSVYKILKQLLNV